ncbi:MAG: SH3 domain-containing protein [Thermomicrobiales bacterium]|nr:SH3 domain-containing protein [Thermomicrobiales bacterium]
MASQSPNEIGSTPTAPAGVGEAIVTADWVVELQQAVFGHDVYDRSDYRAQAVGDSDPNTIGNWAALEVKITNNQNDAMISHFPATAFSLAFADGSEVFDVWRLTPPLPDVSGDYLPGASFTGWAAFERPAEFSGTLVRFQPFRTDEDVRYLTWGDGSAPANTGAVEVAEESTPAPPAEQIANGATVTTNESDVNMRAAASISGEIVETLALGATLTVTGDPVEADGYTWYPVQDEATGNSGYVAANFLRVAA